MTIIMASNDGTVLSSQSYDVEASVSEMPCPIPASITHPAACYPDPDLGLTPDRSPSQLANKKTVRFISPNKSKARRKVKLAGKENNTLADINLQDEIINLPLQKKSGGKKQSSRRVSSNRAATGQTASDQSEQVVVIDEPHVRQENHLDTPELHTTLNIGRDLLHIQNLDIDIVEAVKTRLTVSEKDRADVKQKTYSKLSERSKSPSIFCNTVSVKAPSDLILENTERELIKSVRVLPSRRPKTDSEKPTLMKYFKPELAFHSCVSMDRHGYEPKCLQISMPGPACPRVEQAVYEHHDRITMWHSQ